MLNVGFCSSHSARSNPVSTGEATAEMKDQAAFKPVFAAIVVATAFGLFFASRDADPPPRQPETSLPAAGAKSFVSAAKLGDQWPLTVTEGYVECLPGEAAVFHTGNKTYALNGLAKGRGYTAINPIWKASPNPTFGPKINIGPLLDLALSQCPGSKRAPPIVVQSMEEPPAPTSSVVCDRFVLTVQQTGDRLQVRLSTDLPADTDLMVSISRTYEAVDERGRNLFSQNYFDEKMTVRDFGQTLEVNVSNSVFEGHLRDHLQMLERAGLPLRVKAISNEIEASIVVPVNQTSPRFAKWNANLVGKMVVAENSFRLVKSTRKVPLPLSADIRRQFLK